MRKIELLLGFLLFSVPAFSYQLKGVVVGGATSASSSNYRLWGFIGTGIVKTGGEGVEEENFQELPKDFFLFQNSPNPVISGTYIEYELPTTTNVTLKVYDVTGRAIRILSGGNQPGRYRVYWDGKDNSGNRVASGVYFYRMEAGKFKATRKLMVIR